MILTLLLGLGGPLGWGLLGASAQAAGSRGSDPPSPRPPGAWTAEAEDPGGDPGRRNWCPYQESRLVTFVAACKTEKFLVHSQQPCPQGAPDCQRVRVMYRVAHKPVYQVKQKVLASVAWKCCPGFAGPDCQHHDPTATPEPEDPGDGLQEPWDGPVALEPGPGRQAWTLVSMSPGQRAAELSHVLGRQGRLLEDLQNDLHQVADGLPGLWKALESNLTAAAMEANQTEPEVPGTSLEQVLPLHLDTFLQVHFSPTWRSLNQSLHGLSQALRNLSLDVEANRQAIRGVRESAVARADFQELGAKFESKVQENAQRVAQLRQDVEERMHAQQLSLQQSLSEVQADVDAKVKRALRAQEPMGAAARPEPESLQARLGQLQRNVSALHAAAGRRDAELQATLADMGATLAQHADEIKELYSESDETFEQISRVERRLGELQVNHTALRELRIALMEKSLILEENREEVERQLLELNLTVQQLQGGHADLARYAKDCTCQELPTGLDGVPDDLGERPQPDGSELRALSSSVAALARAVAAQQEEGERARADGARLRSALRALDGEVRALQEAQAEARQELGRLRSHFAALLDDALRHEAALAALLGDDMAERLAEDPAVLPLRYEHIVAALRDAAAGLQEQALAWGALASRVDALEAVGAAGLARELQRLDADLGRVAGCCGPAGNTTLCATVDGLGQALAATGSDLQRHQRLFHSLFGNFQGLLAANVSLDLGQLQAMLSRKGKRQKGLDSTRKRDRKQVEPGADEPARGPVLGQAGSPAAFYASCSGGTAAPQTVKFNTTHVNVGGSYFPDHGYFLAPERGVYLFAVSVEFGPGPGSGQLVFGGHRQTPVGSPEDGRAAGTVTAFALAELQRGERVWFELTRGSLRSRSPAASAFGGLLVLRT
ncbi:multimerin-2 isoform X1 [Vulpes vulpes]|uniref:Multimerin-2 isoform X1 n=1 Tax=Vulpes vulpes TaxID=9627 RepID=A0ABM5ACL2_VULVU